MGSGVAPDHGGAGTSDKQRSTCSAGRQGDGMQKLLVLAFLAGVLFKGYQYLDSKLYRYVLIDPYSQITV